MNDLARECMRRYHCDRVTGALHLARDLMEGDPATFAAGYSADNAAIAAGECFDLDPVEANDLSRRLGLTYYEEVPQ